MSKILFFSSKNYDITFFTECNKQLPVEEQSQMTFLEDRLEPLTAKMTEGFDVVCIFVNDNCNAQTLEILKEHNIKVIALRCAGFNNVDLKRAAELGFKVVRVPAYSPYSVAEHTMGLILTLNRKIHKSYNRVREGIFDITGLMGEELQGKTVALIGTGKIGCCFASICKGFGMKIIGYDPYPSKYFEEEVGGKYISLEEIWTQADIISLHVPLTAETKYLINEKVLEKVKKGLILINTSRGALLNTKDVIVALKNKTIGALGIDVYEAEDKLFFKDMSQEIVADDVLTRLSTFPNVIITGHQAFFTREALNAISEVTLNNLIEVRKTGACKNEVKV